MSSELLRVAGVEKIYPAARRGGKPVRALDGIDLEVVRGRSLGLVGESGCGKTTLARILIGLEVPSVGHVSLEGVRYESTARARRRQLAPKLQMVFQDPKSSLNPRRKVASSIMAPLEALTDHSATERLDRARELVELVELDAGTLDRYPHELSGGQAQRVAIARALAPRPQVVILDEAVASLDVSIGARVLRLLHRLQEQLGVTYVFISHDLATVEVLCDDIAVMYLGRVVESGARGQVLSEARHPYTRTLLSSVPVLGRPSKPILLSGEPSRIHTPEGCAFAPRCYRAEPRCAETRPPLAADQVGHPCACFFANDSDPPEEEKSAGRHVVHRG